MDLAEQDESESQTSRKCLFFSFLTSYLLLGPTSTWPSKAEPMGHGTPSSILGSLGDSGRFHALPTQHGHLASDRLLSSLLLWKGRTSFPQGAEDEGPGSLLIILCARHCAKHISSVIFSPVIILTLQMKKRRLPFQYLQMYGL